MSQMKYSDMDADEKRERLKAEARERWGDRWALRVTEWSDGDTRMIAYHMRGRVRDGEYLERDELKFTSDGEIVAGRVHLRAATA